MFSAFLLIISTVNNAFLNMFQYYIIIQQRPSSYQVMMCTK